MKVLFLLAFGLSSLLVFAQDGDWWRRRCEVIRSGAWDTNRLEVLLFERANGDDYYESEDAVPPSVPIWDLNSLPDFAMFLRESGWTTNQLITALEFLATNKLTCADWNLEHNRQIADAATDVLSQINRPDVREFLMVAVTNYPNMELTIALPGIFRYSCFEPEVMEYLRSVAALTNRYARVAPVVVMEMVDCLPGVPSDRSSVATNAVARFAYYSLLHGRDEPGSVDSQLLALIPEYSNSVQRIAAFRHMIDSVTNAYSKARLEVVHEGLLVAPTNSRNNIEWLEE